MKICVIGAGAIGGLLAAGFAGAGNDVTIVDRGAHLAAIQDEGLTVHWHDGREQTVKVRAVDSVEGLGAQDLVVLALKAHFLDQVARDIDHVLGADTMIMPVQNGIPWWYFHKLEGRYEGQRLESLDASGLLSRHIPSDRITGCVVYPAAGATAPGVITHVEGDRFPIGELDGSTTPRIERLHDALVEAGFRTRILDDIRSEIWLKAWGNLSFNPISALTHATLADICEFRETRDLAATMMAEAQTVAEKLGVTFRHTIDKRIEGARSVGAHKTSMLQDVEQGRSLETEALIGAVHEIAAITATPVPAIAAVYACVKLLNRTMLLEHAGVRLHKVA